MEPEVRRATKKKGKKKRTGKPVLSLEQVRRASSALLSETIALAKLSLKDPSVCTSSEAAAHIVGVPMPSFCLEYLLQNTVLPLEVIMEIAGLPGAGKSALVFEIFRWFRQLGGMCCLLENESKFDANWARSIIGWDDHPSFSHVSCQSMENWQKCMGAYLAQVERWAVGDKNNPGPGAVFPICFALDSLMGKSSEETQNKIETEGFANRHFPKEALSISDYLRWLPQRLDSRPYFFVATNHCKPMQDQRTGRTIRHTAGGKSLKFQETFQLDMSKAATVRLKGVSGITVALECAKNSLGETGRRLSVDLHNWSDNVRDAATGEVRWLPVTAFRWHTATIGLLTKGEIAKDVRDICDLTLVSNNRKVYSRALGIAPSDPVIPEEAGAILMENGEVLDALRRHFGVQTRQVFKIGMDYGEQLRRAKTELLKKIAQQDEAGRYVSEERAEAAEPAEPESQEEEPE